MAWKYGISGPDEIEWDNVLNKPTIPTVRRVETYIGNTNASGNYTVTYASAFPTVPDVQPQTQIGVVNQSALVTSSLTTGFTIQVVLRASINILGSDVLLASVSPVNGASVSVLVTARE